MERRSRATLLAASGLVAPLVAMWTDGGLTVFMSFGYVAPRAGFVDVLRYSTELTQGTFWAGYRFWHLAGLAALGATVAAALDRRDVAAALLGAGAVAVLRFWWALASHTGEGLLAPVGAAWFLGAAVLVAWDRGEQAVPVPRPDSEAPDGPGEGTTVEESGDDEEQDT
mgnify:CR=1 FL=1